MKTAVQRKIDFLKELHQLCIKHKCEMSLSDDGRPYGMHSPTIVLAFDVVYTPDGDVIEQYGEFEIASLWVPSSDQVTE